MDLFASAGAEFDFAPGNRKTGQTATLMQAPVASDLRFLFCVLRILSELNRSQPQARGHWVRT
jgi:hypothetical protein